jgi:hypothetical protein
MPVETPERVANQRFNQKCLLACSNFYNDSPDKSLSEGCRVLKDEVFGGRGVISCDVAQGQDQFPTHEVYLREALLGEGPLRLDRTRMASYKALLGPDYDQVLDRLEAGTVQWTDVDKPIRYESFRRKYKQPEALVQFIGTQKPGYTAKTLTELTRDVCAYEGYTKATRSQKLRKLKDTLLNDGLASRPVDAKKMASDIENTFTICKHKAVVS